MEADTALPGSAGQAPRGNLDDDKAPGAEAKTPSPRPKRPQPPPDRLPEPKRHAPGKGEDEPAPDHPGRKPGRPMK